MSPSPFPARVADALPQPCSASSPSSSSAFWSIAPALRGDHAAVFHFLASAGGGMCRDEFRAQLEEPAYQPQGRLLARSRAGTIEGHVEHVERSMQFGRSALRVGFVRGMVAAPPLHDPAFLAPLLASAEAAMVRSGALVGLAWTREVRFFESHGWSACGARFRSLASARQILAALAARGLYPRPGRQVRIRPWRRVELGAVMALYRQGASGAYGRIQRSEAYWRWLVERHGHGHLYVALRAPGHAEKGEHAPAIVGYATVRGPRILELVIDDSLPTSAIDLVARHCTDAIESGRSMITLEAPADHRLHGLLRAAGGTSGAAEGEEVLMVKVLCPLRLLRHLSDELVARAQAAGLGPATGLGLRIGRSSYRLDVHDSAVTVTARHLGEHRLTIPPDLFARLVLGQLDWEQEAAAAEVRADCAQTLALAQRLFPPLPLWQPPWDDLPGQGD